MNSPEEFRIIASDVRRAAKRTTAGPRRAKLLDIAERFEHVADDLELELAGRLHLALVPPLA